MITNKLLFSKLDDSNLKWHEKLRAFNLLSAKFTMREISERTTYSTSSLRNLKRLNRLPRTLFKEPLCSYLNMSSALLLLQNFESQNDMHTFVYESFVSGKDLSKELKKQLRSNIKELPSSCSDYEKVINELSEAIQTGISLESNKLVIDLSTNTEVAEGILDLLHERIVRSSISGY